MSKELNPKKLDDFLKEAKSNKTESRASYWDDPDLFMGSDEWVKQIKSGKVSLDSDNNIKKA